MQSHEFLQLLKFTMIFTVVLLIGLSCSADDTVERCSPNKTKVERFQNLKKAAIKIEEALKRAEKEKEKYKKDEELTLTLR